MNPYVVIDIGGTSIKYGLADAKGQLLETHEMPTEAQKGGPHILNTTKEIVARYLKKHPLAGVAISSAGMVDPDKEKSLCWPANSQLCRHPIQKGNRRDLSDPLRD